MWLRPRLMDGQMGIYVRCVGELGCLWWCRMWTPSTVWVGVEANGSRQSVLGGPFTKVFVQHGPLWLASPQKAPPSCTLCGLDVTRLAS
jgi:hypothetical protein